jgi:hypothetical protein
VRELVERGEAQLAQAAGVEGAQLLAHVVGQSALDGAMRPGAQR